MCMLWRRYIKMWYVCTCLCKYGTIVCTYSMASTLWRSKNQNFMRWLRSCVYDCVQCVHRCVPHVTRVKSVDRSAINDERSGFWIWYWVPDLDTNWRSYRTLSSRAQGTGHSRSRAAGVDGWIEGWEEGREGGICGIGYLETLKLKYIALW